MRIPAVVAFALLTSFASVPSHAAEPSNEKLAAELLTLTNVEKNLADMRGQIGKMMTAQLQTMEIPAGMQEKAAALQQQMVDLVFDEMSFEKMKPAYIEAYASTFTREELSGLVEFYKSPAGRAFAAKLPALTRRLMEVSQEKTQGLAPRIQEMIDGFVADVTKAETPPSKG